MNGLWALIVSGEDGGVGAGVVVINEGEVLGGDNGFALKGVIGLKDGGVKGTCNVVRFVQGAKPLFPVKDPNFYFLNFEGGFHPERFWLALRVPEQPELGTVTVELRRMTGDRVLP